MILQNDAECKEMLLNGDVELQTVDGHAVFSTPDFILVHDHVLGQWWGASWEDLDDELGDEEEGDEDWTGTDATEAARAILKQLRS